MIDQQSKKISQPTRDDMMRMIIESFKSLEIDFANRFKALWVTNALDGSEDHLVSERLDTISWRKDESFS